jgi:hypothetical protein
MKKKIGKVGEGFCIKRSFLSMLDYLANFVQVIAKFLLQCIITQ